MPWDVINQIVKENLLPVREKLVRVRLVAVIAHILLMGVGIFLALWLGLKLAGPEVSNPWQRILAVGIAMLVGWVPTFVGVLFSSFTRTCLWHGIVSMGTKCGNRPQHRQPPMRRSRPISYVRSWGPDEPQLRTSNMAQRQEVLTWNDVDQLIDHLLPQFELTFDGMIMVSRGGIVPGGILAESMNIQKLLIAAVDFPSELEDIQRPRLLAWPNFLMFPEDDLLNGETHPDRR